MIQITIDRLAFNHLRRKYAKIIEDSYYINNNLENEVWKAMLFDYDDNIVTSARYLISNYGRVRNNHTDKLLKPWKNKDGYTLIDIVEPGIKEVKRQVHRLVGYTFIPNPNNLPQINHKRFGDEFKDLNHVDNLEWVTNSENIKHLYMSTGTDVFSIDELFKIKELIQIDGWTTTSILNALGYSNVTDQFKRVIQSIYKRTSHRDIFDDINIGKRKKESTKFDNIIIDLCIEICGGDSNSEIAKKFNITRQDVNAIRVKKTYKKISDLYFKYENGAVIPI